MQMNQVGNLQLSRAYEVEAVPDLEYPVRIYTPEKDKNGKHLGFKVKTEMRKGGYLVYFPAGHITHVRNEADLAAYGLTEEAQVIDLNTGEAVPESFLSIKALATSKTRDRAMRMPSQNANVSS